jgi:carbon storage regulator CsrA
MLVLTRKTREQIQIGENVVITILRVKGQTVRVGIEAPRDVRVLRSELPKNESAAEEQAAAETTTAGDSETTRSATKPRGAHALGIRSPRSAHPGQHAMMTAVSPLSAKIEARRTPGTNITAQCKTPHFTSAHPQPALISRYTRFKRGDWRG